MYGKKSFILLLMILFYTHRLPLASKAQDQGYEVTVASPSQGSHLKNPTCRVKFLSYKI